MEEDIPLPISKRKIVDAKNKACKPADERMSHHLRTAKKERKRELLAESQQQRQILNNGDADSDGEVIIGGQVYVRQPQLPQQSRSARSPFEANSSSQLKKFKPHPTHYDHTGKPNWINDQHHPDAQDNCEHQSAHYDHLHVVVPINNYVRYSRRYQLLEEFCEHMGSLSGIILYIVEVAFGERPFEVTQASNPRHLQLRSDTAMWHKENMINLCVQQKFPRDWKYMAWIDGDIYFHNKNIAFETIHELQHHPVVQMFQSVANLGPEGQIISCHEGFCYQYQQNGFEVPNNLTKYKVWHPGFAWACTRQGWIDMGGLIDFAILGAADHHMALALVGAVHQSAPTQIGASYRRRLEEFQARCERTIKRNVGYVKGTILHGWHGSFKDRKYRERWEILLGEKYDPDCDIKRDWQGLYIFDNSKPRLRDLLKQYFVQRNEDSIDYKK